ncbi:hypothetical protein RBH26_19510 [Natronolimnohabitans sp. A-GB9]|uniref:hypothetical protein n=1 Tax=Natronolimnohabitans sp. A-GB9 TaxID=3069757 RepID=UPI0027B82C47|nr:hypothetical protein [Natronolimnohabitans sp. A-GB9]MDQ2052649.1 hypothetical protein [Natronolimnohabitans sp. A-GB9]
MGASDIVAKVDRGGPCIHATFPGTWEAFRRRLTERYEHTGSVPNDDGTHLHRARPLEYDPESLNDRE